LFGVVEIKFEGNLVSLESDSSVTVSGDVHGNVDAGGSIRCGAVGGDVDAGGSVVCGCVNGRVRAGGSVMCSPAERR
jgi:cytoskeletal protein CcmA (bactofilin family)